MPSLRERFRSSFKYKKTKDVNTDESTCLANASGTSTNASHTLTSAASSTIDERTGLEVLSSHQYHCASDYSEWKDNKCCIQKKRRRRRVD
jgi:hypothetical protein